MDIPKALRFQGRHLAKKTMDFTPPRTHAQGKKAVVRDIERLFLGLRTEVEEARWQSVGGTQVVRLFSTKDGRAYGADRALFRPGASYEEMAEHHQQYRDYRGRVTRAGTYTRDIGRWRFIDKMVVREADLKEFITDKQRLVGRAKGGWAAAVIGLGGKAPQYAAKWAVMGRLVDRASNPVNAYILMRNQSEWGRGRDTDRVLTNAIQSRRKAILKGIEKAQADALRKAKLK
jgi:hypothetical protein